MSALVNLRIGIGQRRPLKSKTSTLISGSGVNTSSAKNSPDDSRMDSIKLGSAKSESEKASEMFDVSMEPDCSRDSVLPKWLARSS